MASGKMINSMVKACRSIRMDQAMMDNGSKIKNMEKEKKCNLMALATKEISPMDFNTVKGS